MKCKKDNCNKRASYGTDKREYCAEHKKQGMKSFQQKCIEEQCNKKPSFGTSKAEYCFKHKKDDMQDLVHKKCKEENCNKRANQGVYKPEYCSEHKKDDMQDLVHKKCKEENCDKHASYGDDKPLYCLYHKKDDMQDLVHKKCKEENCSTRPSFGINNKEYCFEHKRKGMKSFNKKCINCNLFVASRKPYLCSYCNPKTTKRQKTKENEIEKLFIKNNIQFTKDKNCATNNDCNKYRPDFLIDRNTYFLIVECDEDAHRQYDKECETIRMNNICYNLGLPCVFLRYNPDNKSYSKTEKEQKLLKRVNYYLQIENIDKSIEIEYLFY